MLQENERVRTDLLGRNGKPVGRNGDESRIDYLVHIK
jgi:hypothetical protein